MEEREALFWARDDLATDRTTDPERLQIYREGASHPENIKVEYDPEYDEQLLEGLNLIDTI